MENIKTSLKAYKLQLINRIKTFTSDTGKTLSLKIFIKHYHLSLDDIYSKLSWNRFLVEAGLRNDFIQVNQDQLTKGIRRLLHTNSRRFIQDIKSLLANRNYYVDERMLLMLHYKLWFEEGNKIGANTLTDSINKLFSNSLFVEELQDVLEINYENIHFIDKQIDLPGNLPLYLHCKYTRDEILSAAGYYTFQNKKAQREGYVNIESLKTDFLFVTLNKSEKEYSPSTLYDDYAISETLFHWQSQSTTSDTSKTGRRYLNHKDTGYTILLFIRENKRENGMGAPYYFLGPVNYKNHSGNQPISFIWELAYPMPAHLFSVTAKLTI